MIIESLFDGMSCGMIAAERIGLKIDKYYASEVDKYAIKVSEKNYPNIIRLGDVTNWREWNHKEVDLLIAGSPCQGFSSAGKKGGTKAILNGEEIIVDTLEIYEEVKLKGAEFLSQSHLFWEFIGRLRYLQNIGQAKYFMLENVIMSKENNDMISKALGVKPIEINSALVSAQNRKRLYWTNIPNIEKLEDKGIILNDIIEDHGKVIGATMRGRYEKKSKTKQFIELRKDDKVNCLTTSNKNSLCVMVGHNELKGYDTIKRVYSTNAKCPTLTTMQGGHREPKIAINEIEWRKLTPLECERLQTVPDGYTDCVSNSQRYKMLGNGWTVDVITHIFKGIQNI